MQPIRVFLAQHPVRDDLHLSKCWYRRLANDQPLLKLRSIGPVMSLLRGSRGPVDVVDFYTM